MRSSRMIHFYMNWLCYPIFSRCSLKTNTYFYLLDLDDFEAQCFEPVQIGFKLT